MAQTNSIHQSLHASEIISQSKAKGRILPYIFSQSKSSLVWPGMKSIKMKSYATNVHVPSAIIDRAALHDMMYVCGYDISL
jgi:hypothetical protein